MQSKRLLSLSLIFVFTVITSVSEANDVVVFQSNNDYKRGTPKAKPQFFRIPSLVSIIKNKYVVAFAEERLGGNDDTGDINVVYRVSKDFGATWSPMKRLCELHKNTCGNPTAVVDQTTGVIHIFMSGNAGHKIQKSKEAPEMIEVGDRWVFYTSGEFINEELTFKPLVNMTRQLQFPGTGIQLREGPLAGRLIIPALRRTIFSDDAGKTWNLSEKLSGISSESAIAELNSGHVYRNDRPSGPSLRGPRRRMASISDDGGESFSLQQRDMNLPDPGCQGSLLRYTGDHVFVANCAAESGRSNLTIRMTNDGETWTHTKRIASECGYSSMAKTYDFNVAVLWERTTSNDELKRLGHHRASDLIFNKYKLRDFLNPAAPAPTSPNPYFTRQIRGGSDR